MSLIVDETDRIDPDSRPYDRRFAKSLLGQATVGTPGDYSPFAGAASIKIAVSELNHATANFALAFRPEGEDGLTLVALLGLHESRNLFIAPNGTWMGNYVPAHIRVYPFRVERLPDGETRLGLQASARALSGAPDGHPIADAEGRPSAYLRRMERFATRLHHQQRITDQGCRSLRNKGVLEEWPLSVTVGRRELRIPGFLRVNEEALNALETRDFMRLRQTTGLKIAYAQLVSMRNVSTLAWMYRLDAHHRGIEASEAAPAAHETPELPEDFLLDTDDQFSFDDFDDSLFR